MFLGVPIFGCAAFALWWFTNRQSLKGRGLWSGLAAVFLIPPLAIGCWLFAVSILTTATHVCLDCGRTEEAEYLQRFHVDLKRNHVHRWHLEGCIRSAGRVCCTMQYAQGWFRVLPRLKDRAAADTLFREEQALADDGRLGLMQEVSARVWFASMLRGDLDQEFEHWLAHRRR